MACGWPKGERGLHIQALLMGKAQLEAPGLPLECQLDCTVLSRAMLEQDGSLPEEHLQDFQSMPLEGGDWLFTYTL